MGMDVDGDGLQPRKRRKKIPLSYAEARAWFKKVLFTLVFSIFVLIKVGLGVGNFSSLSFINTNTNDVNVDLVEEKFLN